MINPTVPPRGPIKTDIAFVGEAPGFDEERLGRPFVGKSGKLLKRLALGAGIDLDSTYITNVMKERPVRNDISLFIKFGTKNVTTTEEYDEYEALLYDELAKVDANVIVAVGRVALYALTRLIHIGNYRGSVLESTLLPGKKVIPIIHPAAALRQYLFTYSIALDLKRIKKESLSPDISRMEREVIHSPTMLETIDFIKRCRSKKAVAIDIETYRTQIGCFGLSYTPKLSMSIPFIHNGKDYFNPEQEVKVWEALNSLLTDPNVDKIIQNSGFDATFIWSIYGIETNPIQDTMVAHGILYPGFPKSLAYMTSILTDQPYYKDEGKEEMRNQSSGEAFRIYNATDASVTMEIWPHLARDLDRMGMREEYNERMQSLYPTIYMQLHGMNLDLTGRQWASEEALDKIREYERQFKEVIGKEINLNSTKQLATYFYIEKGAKPVKTKSKSRYSTDEDALKKLVKSGYKEARIIQDHRGLMKLRSSYYEMILDDDNRLRGAFNLVGTTNGRFSSSKTIFRTGGNLQNIPPELREFILPDAGYVLLEFDLSQAENRIVAYISPDPLMIKAFEAGKDIHSLTAAIIFGKNLEDISKEDGSSTLGNGRHSERFWGKTANHALNYKMGPFLFAREYETSVVEAREIIDAYHQGYPGVRMYHRWVEDRLKSKDRTLTDLFGQKRKFYDRFGDDLLKEALAYIPQRSVNTIVKRGLVEVYFDQDRFHDVELLNEVHDSIMVQIPKRLGLKRILELAEEIQTLLTIPLEWGDTKFTIPVEIKTGPTWGSVKSLKDVKSLRPELEKLLAS